MEGNQTRVIKSSDGDIKKLMASAVPESTKRSLKYAVTSRQNKDLTDNLTTNSKINQPFTSDFSVEEGEKNSSRT